MSLFPKKVEYPFNEPVDVGLNDSFRNWADLVLEFN